MLFKEFNEDGDNDKNMKWNLLQIIPTIKNRKERNRNIRDWVNLARVAATCDKDRIQVRGVKGRGTVYRCAGRKEKKLRKGWRTGEVAFNGSPKQLYKLALDLRKAVRKHQFQINKNAKKAKK